MKQDKPASFQPDGKIDALMRLIEPIAAEIKKCAADAAVEAGCCEQRFAGIWDIRDEETLLDRVTAAAVSINLGAARAADDAKRAKREMAAFKTISEPLPPESDVFHGLAPKLATALAAAEASAAAAKVWLRNVNAAAAKIQKASARIALHDALQESML